MKGVLEGAVLELVSRGETYSYKITQDLQALGFEQVVEGTVYTITRRLQKAGCFEVAKRPSPKGPARTFYTLSESGADELRAFWQRWGALETVMDHLREDEK